jgi:hypothetical protein
MLEWLKDNTGSLLAVSVLMFLGTAVVMIILIARMPADYFLTARRERLAASSHPAIRVLLLIIKNVLGLLLLLLGFAMLLGPGQGILAILIGVTLLDIPGKRRLELAIVRRPAVLRAINWIRDKAHRPHLKLPAEQAAK